MEQGGIEAFAVKIDRLTPRTPHVIRRHQEVVLIIKRGQESARIRIHQIELAAVPT
jgi:hypothetical protein